MKIAKIIYFYKYSIHCLNLLVKYVLDDLTERLPVLDLHFILSGLSQQHSAVLDHPYKFRGLREEYSNFCRLFPYFVKVSRSMLRFSTVVFSSPCSLWCAASLLHTCRRMFDNVQKLILWPPLDNNHQRKLFLTYVLSERSRSSGFRASSNIASMSACSSSDPASDPSSAPPSSRQPMNRYIHINICVKVSVIQKWYVYRQNLSNVDQTSRRILVHFEDVFLEALSTEHVRC